jgi:hypothetical protein
VYLRDENIGAKCLDAEVVEPLLAAVIVFGSWRKHLEYDPSIDHMRGGVRIPVPVFADPGQT